MNAFLLSHNDALYYLKFGKLPDNFAKLVEGSLDTVCGNCGGVQDMNMVFRDFFEERENWCDGCCDDKGVSALERWEEHKKRLQVLSELAELGEEFEV